MQVHDTTSGIVKGINAAAQTYRGTLANHGEAQRQQEQKSAFDLKMKVAGMELGRQAAKLEFEAWQLQRKTTGGNTAITDAVHGITPPWQNPIDDKTYQSIIQGASNLPPEQQGAYLGHAQQAVEQALTQQRLQKAKSVVENAVTDGHLAPEQGQQIITDLEDPSVQDMTPDAVSKLIRKHLASIAEGQAAEQVSQVTYQQMQEIIMGQSSLALQSALGLSDEEWKARQHKALGLAAFYQVFWREIDPGEAVLQIKSALMGDSDSLSRADKMKYRANAFKAAASDPRVMDGSVPLEEAARDVYRGITGEDMGGVAGDQGGGGKGRGLDPRTPLEDGVGLGDLPEQERSSVVDEMASIVESGDASALQSYLLDHGMRGLNSFEAALVRQKAGEKEKSRIAQEMASDRNVGNQSASLGLQQQVADAMKRLQSEFDYRGSPDPAEMGRFIDERLAAETDPTKKRLLVSIQSLMASSVSGPVGVARPATAGDFKGQAQAEFDRRRGAVEPKTRPRRRRRHR